jgi:hypothetical protein
MDKKEKLYHVFFVLSNITQIVVESYLAENSEIIESSIIIYPKRFIPTIQGVKTLYFPFYDDKTEFCIPGKNFIKKNKQVNEVQDYIFNLTTGNKFIFYAPHFNISILNLFIKNKNCLDYCYIEEGLLSYMNLSDVQKILPSKKLDIFQSLGFGFNKITPFPDLTKKVICIDKDAFVFSNNKYIIRSETLKQELIKKSKLFELALNNSALFIFDSSVENKMVKIHYYLLAIVKSISYVKSRDIQKLYYKFHPEQRVAGTESFFRKFLDERLFGIQLIELSEDFPLEFALMNSKNLTVIHTMSSISFYAKKFGHKAYSNAKFMFEDNSFKKQYFDPANEVFHFDLIPHDA